MNFFEKNEENLEALVFSLTEREKTTIAISVYDCDDTREKAINYVNQQFSKHQTFSFDLIGQKINSLLAFFRTQLPKNTENSLPIVHVTQLDSLLFTTKNYKVISSPLVTQINMERELLFHEVEGLVILWLTKGGYNRLRMDAPDFMDWVVASFVFENEGDIQIQKLSVQLPFETIDDKSKAEIHELKEKVAQLELRTHKFKQGTKLTIKDQKEYFNLLLSLIDAYKNLHDLNNAQSILEKAYTLAKENKLANGLEFGSLLFDWGKTETDLGNLSKARTLFEGAFEHFKKIEDKPNMAACYSHLGNIHYTLGDLQKALVFFNQFNQLTKELYDTYPSDGSCKRNLSVSNYQLGMIYNTLGDLEKALVFFNQYNKLSKELCKVHLTNIACKRDLAISYSQLGMIYNALGDLEKALVFFNQYNKLSKELYEAYPSNMSCKGDLAVSYSQLGAIHNTLGDLEKALNFFEKNNELVKKLYELYPANLIFKNGLAVSYWQLGEIYKTLNKTEEMLDSYQKSNQLFKALFSATPQNAEFKSNLAESYHSLGQFYINTDRVQAKAYLMEAETLWKELVCDAPQYLKFQQYLVQVEKDLQRF